MVAASLLLAGILAPSAARADSATCAYDPITKTVAVAVTPSNDFAPSLNVTQGEIVISDSDGSSDCGASTVTNTDSIVISSTSDTDAFGPFHVHQPGLFVPGFTDEAGSSDEIEFLVDLGAAGGGVDFDFHASASPVNVAAGGKQINLNAAEGDGIDADVTLTGSTGLSRVQFLDSAFADVIDAGGGGPGVPAQPFVVRTEFGDYVLDTGADVFIGGAAADDLFGFVGDDHLEGGAGKDGLYGGPGNDVILGGPGIDGIDAGAGADTAGGGAAEDTIDGKGGVDALHGNGGPDHILGGVGNDRAFGDAGADTLDGQAGDDALDGGANADVCTGGPGADTFAACETQNP